MGGRGSGRKPDPARRAQARTLRDRGLTMPQVAAEMGVSKQRVLQLLTDRPTGYCRPTIPCAGCSEPLNPAARPDDRAEGLCPACLAARPWASLAVRLRSLRLAAGLTRSGLARKAGVALETVRWPERGESRPQGVTLRKLAGALGVAPRELDPLWG